MYENLKNNPRLLMEAKLDPVQGDRFQPTGFSDLGPAEYTAPDGTPMLLVESTQSMANRMENVCWDKEEEDLIEVLKGLPYIHVELGDGDSYTNSILEAHRINSEYITGSKQEADFDEKLEEEINYDEKKPVDFKELYKALLKYDPNCLIHGVFLEEIAGRLKVPRMLSAFIEARDVNQVQSGGVKFSRVEPGAKEGEGHVPFPRIEYTASDMTAYFNLDVAGLKGMGLPEEATDLLISLSLYKINKFLQEGLRLRTACDLMVVDGPEVTAPDDFELPSLEELKDKIPSQIEECMDLFADPPVTKLEFEG